MTRQGCHTAARDVAVVGGQGEVMGAIGRDVAGSPTIFGLSSGHQRVDAGCVQFDGCDIIDISSGERARRVGSRLDFW